MWDNKSKSYWQVFVADNEQVGVGGLDINSGGQLDGLIGGLSWQIYTNEKHLCEFIHQQHIRELMIIKADKTTRPVL